MAIHIVYAVVSCVLSNILIKHVLCYCLCMIFLKAVTPAHHNCSHLQTVTISELIRKLNHMPGCSTVASVPFSLYFSYVPRSHQCLHYLPGSQKLQTSQDVLKHCVGLELFLASVSEMFPPQNFALLVWLLFVVVINTTA
jgi:hypothetical protein